MITNERQSLYWLMMRELERAVARFTTLSNLRPSFRDALRWAHNNLKDNPLLASQVERLAAMIVSWIGRLKEEQIRLKWLLSRNDLSDDWQLDKRAYR